MIRDFLDVDANLEGLRQAFGATRPRAVIVPGCVDPSQAMILRARVFAGGLEPFAIADRGRYLFSDATVDEALCERLRVLAERVTREPLRIAASRFVCLGAGDYALYKGDEARALPAPHFELTVDFSGAATGGAEITYGDGESPRIAVPQLPGCLSLVERTPGLLRCERYLTQRVQGATVWRLRLSLLPVG